jgi:hypothetical protein
MLDTSSEDQIKFQMNTTGKASNLGKLDKAFHNKIQKFLISNDCSSLLTTSKL